MNESLKGRMTEEHRIKAQRKEKANWLAEGGQAN